jgi:hypothetical protein
VPPAQTWQEQMKSMAGAGLLTAVTVMVARAAIKTNFLSMRCPPE